MIFGSARLPLAKRDERVACTCTHGRLRLRNKRTTGIIYTLYAESDPNMSATTTTNRWRRVSSETLSDEDADARSDRDSAEEKYETDIKQYSCARKIVNSRQINFSRRSLIKEDLIRFIRRHRWRDRSRDQKRRKKKKIIS